MPNLLDSLFFQVGWDTTEFDRGEKAIKKGFKDTAEAGEKSTKETEKEAKKKAEAFRKLRNEALGLFFAIQGASSLRGLITDLISGAASTDRFAKNMGVARNELFAWQNLIKTVGGNAADATTALQAMAGAIQGWRISGTTGNDQAFAALGVTSADFTTPDNLLKKIADASQRMDRPQFAARVSALGFSPEMIELLSKGRGELEKQLDVQKQLATITDEDVEAAKEFQKQWNNTGTMLTSVVRPALISVLKEVERVTLGIRQLITIGKQVASGDFTGAGKTLWNGLFGDADADVDKALNGGGSPRGGDSGSAAGAFPGAERGVPGGGAKGAGGNVSGLFNVLSARYGNERARGIWAGIGAESAWNPNASLRDSTGETYGLGQWRGARLKRLRAQYGDKNGRVSPADQIKFLMSELEGGDPGGASVLNSRSTGEALSNYIGLSAGRNSFGFMRPSAAGRQGDLARAHRYLGGGGDAGSGRSTTNIGTIVINTAATNADGIAKDLPTKLRERGLVVQANSSVSQ